mgnify:FL=1
MKPSKRSRKQKQLLKELESIPNIDRACKKTGIARSTYYRWCGSNPAFSVEAAEAEIKGREKFSDYVESKLMENIAMNHHPSISYWLAHNTTRYRTYTHKAYAEELNRLRRIERTVEEISRLLIESPRGYEDLMRLAKRVKEDTEMGANNRFNKL